MANFGIRLFLCNIFICIIIGFLLIAKRAFKNYLTSRMQFHLWFLLLGILAVPFVPFRPASFTQVLAWLGILFVIKSVSRLNAMKRSALPLQNKTVRILYHNCLREMKIKRKIPIYSTAFLKSPVIVGLFNPRIYLPIHLISDFNAADMRYILLHELQHYRHKDTLAGVFMSFFGVLYWCNPCVWYALKAMLPGFSGSMKQMQQRIANIHLKHGTLTRTCILPCKPPSTGILRK